MVYSNGRFVRKLDGNFKKTKKKLMWIADGKQVNVSIKRFIGYNSSETMWYGEPAIINIQVGEIIQLLRMKYYICDSKTNNTINLIEIPYGEEFQIKK